MRFNFGIKNTVVSRNSINTCSNNLFEKNKIGNKNITCKSPGHNDVLIFDKIKNKYILKNLIEIYEKKQNENFLQIQNIEKKIENIKVNSNSISLGKKAGYSKQGFDSISIGNLSGAENQQNESISIGSNAGKFSQGGSSIAIGKLAAENIQGINSVAIGNSSGQYDQGFSSIAIGNSAGKNTQGDRSIAIGEFAGFKQSNFSVAIGYNSAKNNQSNNSIAIGTNAGYNNQGYSSIAIGNNAGLNNQEFSSIAIGNNAGKEQCKNNSIILNAGNKILNSKNSGLYISPIRKKINGQDYVLCYDEKENEIYENSNKTFVINHPLEKEKYLVHACLEGPEVGIYYRGKNKLDSKGICTIKLPNYVKEIGTEFTVVVSGEIKYKEKLNKKQLFTINSTEVNENGEFIVFGSKPNRNFNWFVQGKRKELEVEVMKNSVKKYNKGPYTWIEQKFY